MAMMRCGGRGLGRTMERLYTTRSGDEGRRSWRSGMRGEKEEGGDMVGPRCERSNLRPVRYGERYWRRRMETTTRDGRGHPYSLQEFGASPVTMPPPLVALKARLDLQNLHWSLLRSRADKLNQTFWESQSQRFEQQENALINTYPSSESDLPNQELLLGSLDQFYARWLIEQRHAFTAYNRSWWGLQPALLKADWLAHIRNLKWKLACWRYAFHS
ncbi:hypothetical protein VP01_2303g1 [Puccinia sorghi]|uniref:Uncharacterized protein n=1 Tax=Puccinia sorghi TaxID=27349 RepID=A0A0L6V7X3_9BASI|nr:hypothetical protein VP01_2303g1 [Puccinia sorghi]